MSIETLENQLKECRAKNQKIIELLKTGNFWERHRVISLVRTIYDDIHTLIKEQEKDEHGSKRVWTPSLRLNINNSKMKVITEVTEYKMKEEPKNA